MGRPVGLPGRGRCRGCRERERERERERDVGNEKGAMKLEGK